MKLKIILPLIALVIVGGFIALRGQSPKQSGDMKMSTSPSSAVAPKDAKSVFIQNYKFNPTPLKVKKGTTVTWTNMDIAKHNITVDDGQPAGGPSSQLLAKNETYQFTFATVGTYKYHCEPHPYMQGSVEVTE